MPGALSRRITAAAILLTLGTGGVDVMSFTRFGAVFASVMTGNLVLLGLAVARTSGLLGEHTAVAFAGYVAGVAAAARLMAPRHGARQAGDGGWPPLVTAALIAELALLAGLAAGWELTGGRPAGTDQYLLLALAATAMGMQSAAVRGLGRGDFSTTYLTGTLTTLVARLVTPGARKWQGWRRPGALLALAGGALISGVLIAWAPAAEPVITLSPICLALAARIGAPGQSAHDARNRESPAPTP